MLFPFRRTTLQLFLSNSLVYIYIPIYDTSVSILPLSPPPSSFSICSGSSACLPLIFCLCFSLVFLRGCRYACSARLCAKKKLSKGCSRCLLDWDTRKFEFLIIAREFFFFSLNSKTRENIIFFVPIKTCSSVLQWSPGELSLFTFYYHILY